VSIRFPSLCSIEIDHPFVPTCLLAERRAQRQSRMPPRMRRHRRSRRKASLTERARCYACLGGTAPRRCAEVIALLFSLADGWEVRSRDCRKSPQHAAAIPAGLLHRFLLPDRYQHSPSAYTSAGPHASAGGARSRAISDRYWRTSAATPRPRSDVSALCRALFFLSRPPD